MKCDELKPLKNIEIAFNTTTLQELVIAEDSEGNCYGFDSFEEVYLKDEVDAAIAELKKFAEDACLERDDNQTAIDELKSDNRRLKRALYKACVNWMANRQVAMACYHLEARARKFDKAIAKCQAKAEEYK